MFLKSVLPTRGGKRFFIPRSAILKFSSYAYSEMETRLVSLTEIRNFMIRCMEKVGTDKQHSTELADVLVAGDYRGHYSHGLNRLEMYVNDIKSGICNPRGEPSIIKETVATAYVNGNNLLGPVVGNFCMKLAMKKAKEVGIGWVVAKGSNHFGICGWYTMQAAKEGLVGISLTNTSPIMAPTRGKKAILGTNPISVAAPAKGDDFVLDMAMTTVALGKVEMQDRKNESIPEGWALTKEGEMARNPKDVLNNGTLLPLGGDESTSGFKGYGLAMMGEIFCGLFGDSAYGPNVRKWLSTTVEANLGQCFVAIDPNAFAPGFEDRMSDLMNICRKQEPVKGKDKVLVAGDPEKSHMAKCDSEGGIRYHINQIKYADELAKKLGIEFLHTSP